MKNNNLSIRITTGMAKNKRIKAPDIPGFRAVQEKAKLALFSILGTKVKDAECLDLFAGSGNLGIEALSRGAKHCDFVDDNHIAVKVISENLKNCDLTEKAEVHRSSSVKFAANTQYTYDLIFVDPFYGDTAHKFLIKNLEEILNDNGVICFFHGKNLDINDLLKDTSLQTIEQKRYGNSFLFLLQ